MVTLSTPPLWPFAQFADVQWIASKVVQALTDFKDYEAIQEWPPWSTHPFKSLSVPDEPIVYK